MRLVSEISILAILSLTFAGCARESSLPTDRTQAAVTKPSQSQDQADNAPELPGINADFPYRVTLGEPFKIDVWLDEPNNPREANQPRAVYMEQTDTMEYRPRVFKLKPGERKTVIAKVLKTTAGLAHIQIVCDGYEQFDDDMDAGFSGKLQAQADESTFESGHAYGLNLNVVNPQNLSIPVDSPVLVSLRSTNADIRLSESDKWSTELKFTLDRGATSSPLIRIKPTSRLGDPATLSAEVRLKDLIIRNEHISLPVQPTWWLMLLFAILGGLVPAVYRAAIALAGSPATAGFFVRSFFKTTAGALAGAGAYMLAGLDVIGVKLDTSSPRTFCILGFLFAYIGLDVLMDRFVKAKQSVSQRSEDPEKARVVSLAG